MSRCVILALAFAVVGPQTANADGLLRSIFNRKSKQTTPAGSNAGIARTQNQQNNRAGTARVTSTRAAATQPGRAQLGQPTRSTQSPRGTVVPGRSVIRAQNARRPVSQTAHTQSGRSASRRTASQAEQLKYQVFGGSKRTYNQPIYNGTNAGRGQTPLPLANPFSDDYQKRKVMSRIMQTNQVQQVDRREQVLTVPQPFPLRYAQRDDDESGDEDKMEDADDSLGMDDEDEDEGEDDDADTDDSDSDSDSDSDDYDEDEDPSQKRFDRDRSISMIMPTLDYAYQDIEVTDLPKDDDGVFAGDYQPRQMPARTVHWLPSNLHHNPLYFEDAALERYGHTHNKWVQPFVSSGKFVVQTIGMPYQIAMDPPWINRSTLGWYRPGECAPRLKYRIPVNGKGSAAQILTTAALILIIP